MAQSLAAALEARQGTPFRSRDEAPFRCGIFEVRAGFQHLEHLLCVGFPVGGQLQHSAGPEPRGECGDERSLDEASLVVTLLVPGIREEDQHFVERIGREIPLEQFDSVVAGHAQVAQAGLLGAQHQMAHSGSMHFDAEEIALWLRRGKCFEVVAVAKTYLENTRRDTAENPVQIKLRRLRALARGCAWIQPVARPEFLQCAVLRIGDPACAQHETADRSGGLRRSKGLGILVHIQFTSCSCVACLRRLAQSLGR